MQSALNPVPRYAVYLAPGPGTALWKFGSKVLGYDADTGREMTGFTLSSMNDLQWKAATARASAYGFHATLKAPFRLAESQNEQSLVDGLMAFCAQHVELPLFALQLCVLDENDFGGFLALTPSNTTGDIGSLEAAVVKALDIFRAPLTESEIAKRNPESLTHRQRDYMSRYGYPFVLEEYRLHFTLSDRLPNAAKIAVELNDLMIDEIGAPTIAIDELVLFKQAGADTRFKIIARAPLKDY